MKLVIGNDHAAVELKNEIKAYLEEKGHEVSISEPTHMTAATIRSTARKPDVW